MGAEQIEIIHGQPSRPYEVVGEIKAKKGARTPFNKRPTPDQLNEKLRSKAQQKGAAAVMNVNYKAGIIPSSWKGLTATGTAIRYTQ